MTTTFSIAQLEDVSKQILSQSPNKVILFNGEMGVGKTTLIKQLCKTLGVKETTSSPTFSLVNEYHTDNNQTVYHFDFYRLNKETEALDMGVDDYFYSGNWCFVEWPEKIESLIPHQHTSITIELLPNGERSLVLK
ncbi:tRNA (adenosine(37)-N6)-threonylcarbamoyltransferase complex ATPase subunit type 1 TsaE [Flavobacterium gilvum]|uniref:tRNA threonylcarbamoyladenosine biosynthesis protein TsaE n=1 Tax=Flavobacterium gilvum TaxID=1492737 RepID=A0AAC9N5P3_9FLAO|nr:tRNA (adenosine(37)-N6)-threonylcarbamoyltransferase complex ATPase subunit type 1 TsaE [Flavobacterium gilvum]AOW10061.1 tRNA (adenosine(37)-N6)-threonylcarbamoyltransferase complex ATPase subunit type 1 TsaE [Flavobacterium gilvum]KFC58680.1 P-loop hydrolase [Flavobacterium gilvum]